MRFRLQGKTTSGDNPRNEWKASPSVIPYDITLSGTEGSKTGTYKINFETVIDGEVVTAQWASSDNGVTVVEKR